MSTTAPLISRVSRCIRKHRLLQPGDTVIVAASGGIDSTSLLHILSSTAMDLKLIAVYVDHGLRPDETGQERTFIQKLASDLNIPWIIKEVNVPEFRDRKKLSTEEAARVLRYRALEDIRKGFENAVIAAAHTADDQVEEFFIRLIRGTGMKGLAGMSYRRDNIIRPLLDEPKSALIEYLEQIGQKSCHDSSNETTTFLRNAIRLELLPKLENEYNPSLRNTVLQEMSILRQDEDLLDTLCRKRFQELCTIEKNSGKDGQVMRILLPCDALLLEHLSLQRRLMEKICWSMQSRPSFQKIEKLLQLAKSGTNGSRLHLPEGLRCLKEHSSLIFEYPQGRVKFRGDGICETVTDLLIEGPGLFTIPELKRELTLVRSKPAQPGDISRDILRIDEEKIRFPLVLRAPLPGEKMKPFGAPGSKKILRILQDMKIPAHRRHNYPVLADTNGPVAILGAKIADRVKITPATSRALLVSWEETPGG